MLSRKEIEEIELKYKRYKIKRALKFYFPIFLIFILFFALYIYNSRDQKDYIVVEERNKAELSEIKLKYKRFLPSELNDSSSNKSKSLYALSSRKSMYQMSLEELIMLKKVDKLNSYKVIPKIKNKDDGFMELKRVELSKNRISKKIELYLYDKKTVEKNDTQIAKVNKKQNKKIDDTKQLIRRFKEKRNYLDALLIAQNYYLKHDYQNAVKWAIEANTINPQNDKSWIIFAKSKHESKKSSEAIKVLRAYLDNYYSKDAQELLKRIIKESKQR